MCTPKTWHKHKTREVMHNRSNPEYYLQASKQTAHSREACYICVDRRHNSVTQGLFCLKFIFFNKPFSAEVYESQKKKQIVNIFCQIWRFSVPKGWGPEAKSLARGQKVEPLKAPRL